MNDHFDNEQRLCDEWHDERNGQYNRMDQELHDDFPEFEDAVCTAILDEVCDDQCHSEDICCLIKRRRIMYDATDLAEAWESAENLMKIFRKNSLPQHFIKVCQFL